jgi:hypothetical protein
MQVKIRFALTVLAAALLVSGVPLTAQAPPPPASADAPDLLSEADLEQLVAPIALYPDPMLALILQASTVPSDIVLANRWLGDGNSADDIDAQPWDDSVKGLARYPDVLQMMDDNLDWTNQLGAAVLAQQPDVMNAIQAMRAKAQTLGNLQTTAQQQVVTDDGAIQIVPANPQLIYVPVYDPQVIYVQQAPAVPLITFGAGLTIGIWLGGDCDWHNHSFYRGGYYRPGYGWRPRPSNPVIWRPNPHRPKPRPPYRPGRPGGHLPGWQRPPNSGKPRPPGNGRPPGNVKPPPGNGNGNRPGGPGAGPGKPGHRPDKGKPSIQPVKPAPEKPTRPVKPPTAEKPTRPAKPPAAKPAPEKPITTQPAKPRPEAKPKPAPERPAATRPAPKPERPHQEFDRQRPSTKRPETRPAPARPAPARQAPAKQARPAPGGGNNANR